MNDEPKNKGGAPKKIKDPHRSTWNVSGEHATWIQENAERMNISESEFVRHIFDTSIRLGLEFYAQPKAV